MQVNESATILFHGFQNMIEFIYKIRPVRTEMLVKSTQKEDEIIALHLQYLKNLYEQGVVTFVDRTLNPDEKSFGMVVFTSENERIAKSIMLEDPAIKMNVMLGNVYPFKTVFR